MAKMPAMTSAELVELRRVREIMVVSSDGEFRKYVSVEDAQKAIADNISADAFKDAVMSKLIDASDASKIGTTGDRTLDTPPPIKQVNNMELYSRRKRAAETTRSSYRYDLPVEFRNQVIFLWAQAAGYRETPIPRRPVAPYDLEGMGILQANQFFNRVLNAFCEAHCLLSLPESNQFDGPCIALRVYFQECSDDDALDIIELTFREIFTAQEDPNFGGYVQPTLKASEAVKKLNRRFQEHAIGFRLEQGMIIPIDSELLHTEAVEPAMQLMHIQGYKGALGEFLLAHKYFRQGPDHYDDCLTNCLKALESALKQIIELRKWDMPGDAKFDNLFAEVKKKGLFPPFLGSHLGELKKFLQAVAVIRNEEGAHGSGSVPNEVPDHLVAYQLHLTASAIVFLIRANEDFGKRKLK
jgi:hypothetical protein